MVVNKDRLTPQRLESFMEHVRRDHSRIQDLTTALSMRGFRAVIDDWFELTPEQRAALDAVMTKEFETICRDACLVALRTGGAIRYAVRKTADAAVAGPPALRANVECEGDLDELHCGVTFEC
jgi:hypothetical protein